MLDTLVYYHKNCIDGITSAMGIYSELGDNARYLPIQYGDPIISDIDKYKRVVFVDYCPSKDQLISLYEESDVEVVIIDHHVTSMNVIREVSESIPLDRLKFHFEMGISGAVLVHQIVHGVGVSGVGRVIKTDSSMSDFNPRTPYEEFIYLVGVRDVWHETDKERADILSSALRLEGVGYSPIKPMHDGTESSNEHVKEVYDRYYNLKSLEELMNVGSVVRRVELDRAKSLVAKSYKESIIDGNGLQVEVAISYAESNISDAGDVWCREMNSESPSMFIGIMPVNYSDNSEDTKYVFSVRSNHRYSARKFCERVKELGYGDSGGGHDQAAGATITSAGEIGFNNFLYIIREVISEL